MYGDNAREIRDALASLLRQHRITQRLGGPGIWSVPASTTPEQRHALGTQVQRYRKSVLVWCHEAVHAGDPRRNLELITEGTLAPVERLSMRLGRAIQESSVELPTPAEFTAPQEFELVDLWRRAARAAALGEHDFAAGVGHGRLSRTESLTVVKDAADITRGLVILDTRYANVPGWRPLANRGWLGRTAEACSLLAGQHDSDYTADGRGDRPTAARIQGPALPGLAGVLQAQHNLLVSLHEFPNALNLRRVLHSQGHISHEVAQCFPNLSPELRQRFLDREHTFKVLLLKSRNIGGLLGNGGRAASDSMTAMVRLEQLRPTPDDPIEELRQLDRLFTRTDARLAAQIERGIREKLYSARTRVPCTTDRSVRPRWLPLTSSLGEELLGIVRDRLRPAPMPAAEPSDARASRESFEAALHHRPGRSRSPRR